MSIKRTAIVTGASSGLGRAIAHRFADAGYNLVLNGRNADRLEETRLGLGADTKAVALTGDVASAGDRIRLVDSAIDAFGRIDVLVNNAGIFEPRPFLDVDEEYLDRFIDTNLKSTFFLSQAVIPHMREAGGGSIVNIGTVLVDHAITGVPVTAPIVSKGAIQALAVQLAAEFGPDNIRVNTISPGVIRTPIHARNGIEDADSLAGLHLLGRIGEPDDIASAALMLAGNTFISGANLNVDGGHLAGHSIQ